MQTQEAAGFVFLLHLIVFDASFPRTLNFNCLFHVDGGDQKWPMLIVCLAGNSLRAASSASWDTFFCPSDHKSSPRSGSHGDNISLMISRDCPHPQNSLAWALTTGSFPHQSSMSHSFGNPTSCLAAFAEVMRPQGSALPLLSHG